MYICDADLFLFSFIHLFIIHAFGSNPYSLIGESQYFSALEKETIRKVKTTTEDRESLNSPRFLFGLNGSFCPFNFRDQIDVFTLERFSFHENEKRRLRWNGKFPTWRLSSSQIHKCKFLLSCLVKKSQTTVDKIIFIFQQVFE